MSLLSTKDIQGQPCPAPKNVKSQFVHFLVHIFLVQFPIWDSNFEWIFSKSDLSQPKNSCLFQYVQWNHWIVIVMDLGIIAAMLSRMDQWSIGSPQSIPHRVPWFGGNLPVWPIWATSASDWSKLKGCDVDCASCGNDVWMSRWCSTRKVSFLISDEKT